jgi:hypothetical protein
MREQFVTESVSEEFLAEFGLWVVDYGKRIR